MLTDHERAKVSIFRLLQIHLNVSFSLTYNLRPLLLLSPFHPNDSLPLFLHNILNTVGDDD